MTQDMCGVNVKLNIKVIDILNGWIDVWIFN